MRLREIVDEIATGQKQVEVVVEEGMEQLVEQAAEEQVAAEQAFVVEVAAEQVFVVEAAAGEVFVVQAVARASAAEAVVAGAWLKQRLAY